MADDQIPVKDTSNNAFRNADAAFLDQRAAQQRRMVSKWDRDELEDKYLRIHEENLLLKKHARKQEEKIKKMATKLLRLVNDRKKHDVESGKVVRDMEVQDRLLELQEKLEHMEKLNNNLHDKLALAKQQVQSVGSTKRTLSYPHVQSRINTGIPKHQTMQIDPRIAKNIRVIGPSHDSPKRTLSPSLSKLGHGVFEDLKAEKHHLEEVIARLQEQLNIYEVKIEELKEQNKMREVEFEEDIIKIKQQITSEQRQSVQENIDMIKLQREMKDKSTRLIALQDKYTEMEENARALKHNHDQILMEMERLNVHLKEEQNRVLTLQNELKMAASSQRRMVELQEQVIDLQREVTTLNEANQKLVSSAFDLEREREWRQRENKLKVQIAQLEATLKSDLGEKGSIIDRYASERDANEKLQQEFRELQIQHFQMKEQYDDLQEKLKFFTKESALDLTELEDALVLVKQKKQRAMPEPDFLQRVDAEINQDNKQHLLELQAEYAETVHELEKTRNMLVVQHRINKDYQKEMELSSQRLDEVKKEYELKLDEYARLLDIRAARIKKLEAQLRDVAYGTRQYKISPPDDDVESSLDLDETIQLERGQNLFEIHIEKVNLSEDAIRHIGDEEPSIFCTWEFFEFEIQTTPVLRGSRPVFDFTSQYIVKVDDFFLHYIQKESCTLELHQSFGQEYRTVAACQLVFREIFDKPHGRIHGKVPLTGVTDADTGVGYGSLEYWVRLRVPMDQALRLYKERTKAMGYLTANTKYSNEALKALDDAAVIRPLENVNELHIKIIKCSRLKSRREGIQPSPYCVYKFFDFNDHDTIIVRNSNNPEFHDHRTYPVPMTQDLDEYLRTSHLDIYVFDDAAPEEAAYIGYVNVPLMSLRDNKERTEKTFELRGPDDKQNVGTIDVELYWQHEYFKPKCQPRTPLEMDPSPEEEPIRLTVTSPQPKPALITAKPRTGPSATSTPMPLTKIESEIIPSSVSSHKVTATPKPTSRRKLLEERPAESLVNDTVSQVVSGFMPHTSESLSSITETSTIHMEKDERGVNEPYHVDVHAPAGPILHDEEEEELVERPFPSRSSLNIESGSTSEEGERHLVPPRPKLRIHLNSKLEKVKFGSQSLLNPNVKPPEQSKEDDEESVPEEIIEEEKDMASTLQEEETQLKFHPPIVTPVHSEEESDSRLIESDSEGVTVVAKPTNRRAKMPKPSDSVTVVVSHLTLNKDSPLMTNPAIRQLFVEYRFLGLSPQETETPFSLPKPTSHQTLTFNFSKTIAVDMKHHYERRQHLAGMLLPDDPDKGRIRFTVVSEPAEDDQEGDCEDVGVAYVSVQDILKNKRDVKDQDIEIWDIHDESKEIGQINLTVECLSALQAVDLEMQVDGTY